MKTKTRIFIVSLTDVAALFGTAFLLKIINDYKISSYYSDNDVESIYHVFPGYVWYVLAIPFFIWGICIIFSRFKLLKKIKEIPDKRLNVIWNILEEKRFAWILIFMALIFLCFLSVIGS